MRTNIDIDDALMADTMASGRYATKKQVVEEGLRELVRRHRQRAVLDHHGKFPWEGDLDAMRRDD